jgi:hypothetical protein
VDGSRRRNHCAAHFMEKTREKGEWTGAGVDICGSFQERTGEKGEWKGAGVFSFFDNFKISS